MEMNLAELRHIGEFIPKEYNLGRVVPETGDYQFLIFLPNQMFVNCYVG